jgi:hypothetical protein
MNTQKHQQGFLSILAVLLIVIISFMGIAATYQSTSDSRQAANSLYSSQAFYIAQSGIEYALHLINSGTQSCGNTIASPNAATTGLPGIFSVTTSLSSGQCTLTSTGYAQISGTNTSAGIRTVQAVFLSSGIAPAPLNSAGPIAMSGNSTITNLSVSASSPDYAGSTINSGGTVTISGSGSTVVNGLNPSSTSSTPYNADISQNNGAITSSNLFSQFFSVPMSQIKTTATQVTDQSQLNNPSGTTYYSEGSLELSGNNDIGSSATPAILIVNGNLTINGNTTFYGLIYVTGSFSMSGNTTITGAIAAVDATQMSGSTVVTFDANVLTNARNTNPNTILHFYEDPISFKEIIA